MDDHLHFKGDLKEFQIVYFLRNFKEIMAKNRLRIVNRKDHQKSLASLGLTREDCEKEILSLSQENYYRGPEPNGRLGGEIWEFGKIIGGREVYIKLKIAEIASEKFAKCISFHPAESPLCYPYKPSE